MMRLKEGRAWLYNGYARNQETRRSTFPPDINAFEFYLIIKVIAKNYITVSLSQSTLTQGVISMASDPVSEDASPGRLTLPSLVMSRFALQPSTLLVGLLLIDIGAPSASRSAWSDS